MSTENTHDFAMEKRLWRLSPSLHQRFTDAVFALQHILSNYKLLFPDFTDHSELHSLNVIDFCNRLIGDQISRLNPDELYCLLMGCYFHDTGMGVSRKDFEEFSAMINFGDYFETHSRDDYPRIIRDYHNEFSALFLKKYADFFEIPSEAHLRAILEISRGHRKTNLLDEIQYPVALPVPGGSTVCLPYLAALIRLADEIDVAAARNSLLLYDIEFLTEVEGNIEFQKHLVVRDLIVTRDAFLMQIETDDPKLREKIYHLRAKMQQTLDRCREAVLLRTPHVITQERVEIIE